jgi:hypothetical protein
MRCSQDDTPIMDDTPIEYKWQQISIFITWKMEKNAIIIFFAVDRGAQELYVNLMRQFEQIHDLDPYSWHVAFVEEARKLYDKSVWSLRNYVRGIEMVGNRLYQFSKSDY